ncbi:50S ribosomal protein L10 [Papillibacter cinnamivorans]|uniref:Large ribosomal subunit protein uL10 n=1 Tax=Papillibacter cinnamivorans DSM 12816 TaxID=1122930 RepID=A0A1W1Z264_9FIRM|nr:50S ribosomal protein L10 [Papillibacter cinnamivorans]SMC42476.1 large subunit ribosomal protein L10 [Papillibacter cinnamivorans DSM 12816]
MPNAKVLSEKQAIVDAMAARLQNSTSGVLVDYKGITVAEDTALRTQLRKSSVEYTVVKNTLTRFAAKKSGLDALDPFLNGTTALATSTDPVAPAKILTEFAKKMNNKFEIKAGFVEGKVILPDEITALAELPPKEVLVAQVLGTMIAPITGFATVLNANIRGLAVVLQAISEKQAQ